MLLTTSTNRSSLCNVHRSLAMLVEYVTCFKDYPVPFVSTVAQRRLPLDQRYPSTIRQKDQEHTQSTNTMMI